MNFVEASRQLYGSWIAESATLYAPAPVEVQAIFELTRETQETLDGAFVRDRCVAYVRTDAMPALGQQLLRNDTGESFYIMSAPQLDRVTSEWILELRRA